MKMRVGIILFLFLLIQSISINAYTNEVGVEDGDIVILDYTASKQSTGEVFDRSNDMKFTITAGQLIQGFYEGMLGMKIGENKTITVPPSKGYTDPSSPLYGETLIFEVHLKEIVSGSRTVENSLTTNSSITPQLELPLFSPTIVILSFTSLVIIDRKILTK